MRRRDITAILIALGLVAEACGSGSGAGTSPATDGPDAGQGGEGGGPPEEWIPRDDFPQLYADLLCGWERSCCEASGYTYEADENCRQEAETSDIVSEVLDSEYSYDGTKAAACLGAVAARGICDVGQGEDLGVCYGVSTPQRTTLPGQPCTGDQECVAAPEGPGACAVPVDSSDLSGTCRVPVRGAQGDPCMTTCNEEQCLSPTGPAALFLDGETLTACFVEDDLTCDALERVCIALPAVGDPCNLETLMPCDIGGLVCDPDTATCRAPRGVGAPCPSPSPGPAECGHDSICSDDLVCIELSPEGAPCEWEYQCANDSCLGGVCTTQYPMSASECAGP